MVDQFYLDSTLALHKEIRGLLDSSGGESFERTLLADHSNPRPYGTGQMWILPSDHEDPSKNKRYDPLLERQSLFGIAQFLVGRNASWWPESTNFLHGRGDLRVIHFFVLERGRYHDERRRNVKLLYSVFSQVQLFMVPKLFSPYPVGCFWSIGINRKSSMKSIYMSEDHFQMIMMNARHGSENKVGDLYLVVGKPLIK